MLSDDSSQSGIPETAPSSKPVVKFSDLDLPKDVLQGITEAGFDAPSPIQVEAIPHVMSGGDLIAQAQTGSGKTAAFVIPSLASLKRNKSVEILVIVPTRELCQQVVTEFERLGKHSRIGVVSVVGGQSSFRQIEQVNRGANVVVATPGRLLDHLSSKRLKNFKPHMVILDEADEMLDMGFIEDIRKILTFTPNDRQTMLFSATIPAPIARLARESLKDPKQIKLVSEGDTHKDIEQRLYVVKGNERESALLRLMEEETPEKAVVFCRTRRDTIELHEKLTRRGFMVQALHGDLSQDERTRAMESIKRGRTKILVATDVASRGLDIKDLSHVINYQLPECSDRYTHRIGRTGRAGNKGMAISFVTPTEFRSFNYLRHALNNDLKLARLASRTEIDQKKDQSLFEEIREMKVYKEAEIAIDQFTSKEEARDLLVRMYSYIKSSQQISGPEQLGFSIEETERLLKNGGGGGRKGGRSFRGGGGRRGSWSPEGRGRSGQGGRGRDFDRKRPGGGSGSGPSRPSNSARPSGNSRPAAARSGGARPSSKSSGQYASR